MDSKIDSLLPTLILSVEEDECLNYIAYNTNQIRKEYVDLALRMKMPRVASKIMELLICDEDSFLSFLHSFFGEKSIDEYQTALMSLINMGFPITTMLFMLFYDISPTSYTILKYMLETQSVNLNILIRLDEDGIEYDTNALEDATPIQLLLSLFTNNERRADFIEMLKLLIRYGANPSMPNSAGKDAYYILDFSEYEIKSPEEIRILLNESPDAILKLPTYESLWWNALYYEKVDKLQKLAPHVDINAIATKGKVKSILEGDAPITWAASRKSSDLLKKLVELGADVNATDKYNCQALYYACTNSNEESVRILLEKGASVNMQNMKKGFTPLMVACYKNCLPIVKLLLQAGADVNLKNHDGHTALDIATEKRNIDIAEALLRAGASLTVSNKFAVTVASTFC